MQCSYFFSRWSSCPWISWELGVLPKYEPFCCHCSNDPPKKFPMLILEPPLIFISIHLVSSRGSIYYVCFLLLSHPHKSMFLKFHHLTFRISYVIFPWLGCWEWPNVIQFWFKDSAFWGRGVHNPVKMNIPRRGLGLQGGSKPLFL